MKPLTKIALITSGVLTVTGLGCIAASMALGVRPSQLLNLAHTPPLLTIGDGAHADFERSYDNALVDALEIDVEGGTVTLLSHDEEHILVQAVNPSSSFSVYEEDNCLSISDESRIDQHPLELTVTLPERLFREIELDVGIGDVTASESLYAEELDIDIGVGELNLNYPQFTHLDADIGTGNADLTLPGKQDDYCYRTNCGLGELSMGNRAAGAPHHREREHHEGFGNSMEQNNGAAKSIDIEVGIGDIQITFSEEDL